MLTLTLRGLERDGLVKRTVFRRSRPGWTTSSRSRAHVARAHPGAVRLGGRQSDDGASSTNRFDAAEAKREQDARRGEGATGTSASAKVRA